MPYGRYEAIISNWHVRVAFAANKVETAKLISDEEPADACSPRDLRLPPTPDWGRSPPFFWDSKFPSPGVAARSCAWSICTSVTRLLPPGAPDAAKGAKLADTEHVERATWNEVGPGCPARSAKSGQADLVRSLVID